MKKHLLIILLLLMPATLFSDDGCCCDNSNMYGRSFMFTRPANQHLSTTLSLFDTLLDDSPVAPNTGLEIIGLYQQSNELRKNARYFLFGGKDVLTVAGDLAGTNGTIPDDTDPINNSQNRCPSRDIRAEWLGLPSNFVGSFTINPWQRQYMVNIHARKNLGEIFDSPFFNNTWFNVYAPIVMVQNNLGLKQLSAHLEPLVLNPVPLAQAPQQTSNIYEALNQRSWQFGRMTCHTQSLVQLAELRLTFEQIFWAHNDVILMYYSALSIPTGNIQDPTYMFSPVAGNNGHFGFGPGVCFQIPLNRDYTRCAISLFVNFESIFYARNTQTRTMDLKRKPWSRYTLLVDRDSPSTNLETIPAVNFLTREVIVRQYNDVDFSTGIRVTSDSWEFEIGYNIWGHGGEILELMCPLKEQFGLAGAITVERINGQLVRRDIPPAAPGVCASTASTSGIKQQAPYDLTNAQFILPNGTCSTDCQLAFVPIKSRDLDFVSGLPRAPFIGQPSGDVDLISGAAGSAFNNKFHAAFGFTHEGKTRNSIFGIGFFCDIPSTNAALSLIGAWIKCGTTF